MHKKRLDIGEKIRFLIRIQPVCPPVFNVRIALLVEMGNEQILQKPSPHFYEQIEEHGLEEQEYGNLQNTGRDLGDHVREAVEKIALVCSEEGPFMRV